MTDPTTGRMNSEGPAGDRARTEEWLAVPASGSTEAADEAVTERRKEVDLPRAATTGPTGEELAGLQERVAAIEASRKEDLRLLQEAREEARRAEDRAAKAEERLDEVMKQLATLQGQAASGQRTRRDGGAGRAERTRQAKPKETTGQGEASPESRPVNGSRNINSANWDELRALGLSVTDSARLLASREVRGGFDSLDELGELHEFPMEMVDRLKAHFRA